MAVLESARAQEQTLEVTRNGVTIPLTLPEYKSDGVAYASMTDVARQLGASRVVGDSGAAMELDGERVEIDLEDVQATAGQKVFILQHPVRGYNGDALIAIDDLVYFLREGFGFGTPTDPPAMSALRPRVEEVQLESIDLPAADTPVTEVPEAEVPAAETPRESAELEILEMEETTFESVASVPSDPTVAPLSKPLFVDTDDFLLGIDPGHGGADSGVTGPNGLMEKNLCLAVASSLRRILKEQYGIATVMTREQDEGASIQNRSGVMTSKRADLVISLHTGWTFAPGATGPVLFAHRPPRRVATDPRPGLRVAEALAKSLTEAAGGTAPPVYDTPLLLLRHGKVPGVLVELGNLADPDAAATLADEQYQATLAAALAEGISRAIGGAAAEGEVQ